MSRKQRPRPKKKAAHGSNKVTFRSDASIGFAGAEDDREYLTKCYVDIAHAERALNTDDPGSILLGRTGSGKTAAIMHIIDTQRQVIQIDPENLSLTFISNSNILSFFHELGVNLDLFFQLLWRHVICVELLNYYYNVQKDSDIDRVFDTLKTMIGQNKPKRLAIDYLRDWGGEFWKETHQRIKEIVENFENELTSGVDLRALNIPINVATLSKIGREEKQDIVNQARQVVNKVQIKHLSDLMDVMAEHIFTDKQKKYYIVIDKLDENWVDSELRYRLIRALIETIKSFRKISPVKLIIALRSDLLERVYRYTRSDGFQPEKYEDFNVTIRWSKDALYQVVNRRIGELYKREYTKNDVEFYDMFPPKYRQREDTFQYLFGRTLQRPRDIIAFVNEILFAVGGKTTISAADIDKAEVDYSRKRLDALCVEWHDEHPNLENYVKALRNMPQAFSVRDFSESKVEELALRLYEKTRGP